MKILKLLTGALVALVLSTSVSADIGPYLIIEEDNPRVSYTGWWLEKENSAAADGEYVVGKASQVSPAEPGSMYIDVSDANFDQLYRVSLYTLLGDTEFRSSDMVVKVYHADGVYEGSMSIVGPSFESKGYTAGVFRGVIGIEISNDTSDSKHVVVDYVELLAVSGPSSGKPNYRSSGFDTVHPNMPIGNNLTHDVLVENGVYNFTYPAVKPFGNSIALLDDKDNNGIKEFITTGKLTGNVNFTENRYGSELFIISTNADGSVQNIQEIGYKTANGTGLKLDEINWAAGGSVLREIGDFDSNGTSDILLTLNASVTDGMYILLMDYIDGQYMIDKALSISSSSGALPLDIVPKVLFQSAYTYPYGDADNNGTLDFITMIPGSGNAPFEFQRGVLGYSSSTPVNVLVLMNPDATVKEIRHFQYGRALRPIGDIDGDGVVDAMVYLSSTNSSGYTIVLLNGDFSVKSTINGDLTIDDVSYAVFGLRGNFGDTNADGIQEVVATIRSSQTGTYLALLYINADGSITNAKLLMSDLEMDASTLGGSGHENALLSDMDNDGDLDLLFGDYDKSLSGSSKGSILIRFYD